MATTRIAFTCEVDFDGTTAFDMPTIPAIGTNGWSEVPLTGTIGRLNRSSMTFVGAAGYVIRELSVNQTSNVNLCIAMRPPQGITYAGGFLNLELLFGSFGADNDEFPNAPQVLTTPKYVPPGWELVFRSAAQPYAGQGGAVATFMGDIGIVFDTLRDFEEAIDAFKAMDVPRAAVVDWTA